MFYLGDDGEQIQQSSKGCTALTCLGETSFFVAKEKRFPQTPSRKKAGITLTHMRVLNELWIKEV